MKKIASFQINHLLLEPGLYISRVDGDITTYDLRTKKPNCGVFMDASTLHSVEHLFATFIRNSSLCDDVIYFGPMGCQTGFYLLVRNADDQRVLDEVKNVLQKIIVYDGPVPGNSPLECGNYKNLDLATAQKECQQYYHILSAWETKDMTYPV